MEDLEVQLQVLELEMAMVAAMVVAMVVVQEMAQEMVREMAPGKAQEMALDWAMALGPGHPVFPQTLRSLLFLQRQPLLRVRWRPVQDH